VLGLGAADAGRSQEDCPTGRASVLTRSITPVFGKGPLWVTPGPGPIKWSTPNDPVELMWVRDRTVPGQAVVTGAHRVSGAKVKFTRFGSRLSARIDRLTLDNVGRRPKLATDKDVNLYIFEQVDGYFPEPGCYEMSGRVGRQQTTIYLRVGGTAGT
jgi:hypothetical protein